MWIPQQSVVVHIETILTFVNRTTQFWKRKEEWKRLLQQTSIQEIKQWFRVILWELLKIRKNQYLCLRCEDKGNGLWKIVEVSKFDTLYSWVCRYMCENTFVGKMQSKDTVLDSKCLLLHSEWTYFL